MKKLITTIVILLAAISFNLKAIEFSANYEPTNSDLMGITWNSSTILCYGSHGIIMKSDIAKKNWKQIYIGELDTIKKIIDFKDTFIGITSKCLIKSIDNGNNWIKLYLPLSSNGRIISLTKFNDTIIVLTSEALFRVDLTKSDIIKLVDLNDYNNINFFELENDGKLLYFAKYNLQDHRLYISNINLKNKEIKDEEIEYETNEGQRANSALVNLKLKFEGNKKMLFLNTNFYVSNSTKIYEKKTINSIDKWEIVYNNQNDSNRIINTITLYKGNVFILSPDTLNYVNLLKLEENGSITQITKQPIDRLIKPDYSVHFSGSGEKFVTFNSFPYINDVAFISDSLLFAVDNNKLIIMSDDGGTKWKVISSFYSFSFSLNYGVPNLSSFGTNNIYMPNSYINNQFLQILKTTNEGITWLPQTSDSLRYWYNCNLNMSADTNGKVFLFLQNRTNRQDIEFYYSNDAGDNFFKKDINNIFAQDSSNISEIFPYATNLIVKTVFLATKEEYPKSTFYILDKEFNLKNKVVMDSVLVYKFGYTSNNELFALGLKYYQFMDTDSGYYYNRKVLLFKSTDGGNSWKELNINIPATFDFFTIYKNERIYSSYLNSLFFNDKVIILNSYTSQNQTPYKNNKLYYVDLLTQTIDSTVIITNNYKLEKLFSLNNQPFIVDANKDLFYHINLNNNPIIIDDSIKIKDLLPFYKNINDNGKNLLLDIIAKKINFG
jgi:photosystem II stability/assembly factor-like uncharacterized protein